MTFNLPATNTDGSNAVIAMMVMLATLLLSVTFSWYQDAVIARQAKQWPTVQGTVISSRVVHSCKGGKFQAVVHYAYKVEGRSYAGDKTAFGPSCLPENEARILAAKFPVGDVKVWFNPQNPEMAALMVDTVLDKTWTSIYTMTCLSAILLLVAGYWFHSTRPYLKS